MTAAMISGTFADFKLVKTRSVAQLVVEVPIEQADSALKLLGGVPQPGAEKPVAVARLAVETQAAPPAQARRAAARNPDEAKPKRPWSELKLSARAAIICGEPEFWRWAQAQGPYGITIEMSTQAADWLRWKTSVGSRKDYETYEGAGRRYLQIEEKYLQWKHDQRYGDDTPPPDPHPRSAHGG